MNKPISFMSSILLSIPLVFGKITLYDIQDLREELREEFDASGPFQPMLATTVRLAFHDCAGASDHDPNIISICNGCINEDNADNAGLVEGAVTDLNEIYGLSQWNQKMSRADFFAAAATIGIEYAQELDNTADTLPTIPYYFGRKDCGTKSKATTLKPLPAAKDGWKDTNEWFSNNFEFTTQETVAILGAHTLGQTHLDFSGYSNLPWVNNEHIFNNRHYKNLLDKNSRFNWTQSQSDAGLWEYRDMNEKHVMLNADMSLVTDIDDSFDQNDIGKVNCDPKCPINQVTIDLVKKYAASNQIWLNDFSEAFIKMITTGYNINDLTVINADSKTTDKLITSTDKPIESTETATTDLKTTMNSLTTDKPTKTINKGTEGINTTFEYQYLFSTTLMGNNEHSCSSIKNIWSRWWCYIKCI